VDHPKTSGKSIHISSSPATNPILSVIMKVLGQPAMSSFGPELNY